MPYGSRARRVDAQAALLTDIEPGFDYADSFRIDLAEPSGHTAEAFMRRALDEAPTSIKIVIRTAHRHVLGFAPGPERSPDHVLGLPVTHADHDEVQLTASSPLLKAVIVGHRPDERAAQVTTFVWFRRPRARRLWCLVGPVHRRVARMLLERAARSLA